MTVTDIMDRKKMEQEMSESEAKFRSFTRAVHRWGLIGGRGRKVHRVEQEPRGHHSDGYGPSDRSDHLEVYDSLTSAEQRKAIPTTKVKEVVTEILTTGSGPYIKRRFEVEFTRADGEVRRTSQTIFPIKTQKGHRMGSIVLDVTESRTIEEGLKRSNAELQQFVYIASHDLREPLRMVSSYLDLIKLRYDERLLDARAREYLGFAAEGAERMRQMIDHLLSIPV